MKDQFIPGIFNYCDRWCEHCPLTNRCRVYADENDMTEDQKDIKKEAFWEYLNSSLEQALQRIHEHMEELDIDWKNIQHEAGFDKSKNPSAALSTEQQHAQYLAGQYYQVAEDWLGKRKQVFEAKEQNFADQLAMGIPVMPEATRLSDALEVINWYSFFIRTKLSKALIGLHDEEMLKTFPLQNAANGHAKITLLSVERSLSAWEVVRSSFPELSDELLDIFVVLGQLRQQIQSLFPMAEAFIRPGFDDVEPSPS